MSARGEGEEQYLVGEAEEILATDPRLGELSLRVTYAGGKLFVSGDVATEHRREAIAEVLGERFPDLEISNDTSVFEMEEPREEERL